MKNTDKRFLSLLLTALLLLGTVAFSFSAAAEEADYNWQPIPTSPEGLAEGEYYLDFSRYMSSIVQWTMGVPVENDLWFFDENAYVLKSEPAPGNPSNTVPMGPDAFPVCMQYYLYRFLTRVGENWFVLSSLNPAYNIAGNRVDYPALARKVIADDAALTEADYGSVLAAVQDGEWMVDLQHGLMKGCYLLPAALAQSETGVYRFVYPSAVYFENCITTELPPAPEVPDLTSCGGQWSDNISWTLEDGVLTVSGTGKMEAKSFFGSAPVPHYSRIEYFFGRSSEIIRFRDSSSSLYSMGIRLLDDEIHAAFYGHFGVVDSKALELALMRGEVDVAEVQEYYMNLTTKTVQTLVVEEGITEIDSGMFSMVLPEKIILPASLNSATLYPGMPAKQDLYILNADAQFGDNAPLKIYVSVVPEALAACLRDYDIMPFARALYVWEFEKAAFLEFAVETLKDIAAARAPKTGYYSYFPDLDEPIILANWNYQTGSSYSTIDALIAHTIAEINETLDTDFAELEDVVSIPSAGSTWAPTTAAYDVAYEARFRAPMEEFIAEHPEYEPLMGLLDSDLNWHDILLGEPLPVSEDETVLCADPKVTIHGYAGSTAEAAAAASGVRFVPLCTIDPMHEVTEKETAPTCTEAGHSKGWYCEDCGTWLTGEAIDPTDHTPGSPVREDLIPPTCIVHGCFDDVIYCMQCGCEINRTHEVMDAVGHAWGEWTVVKAPTTNEEGMEQRVCTNDTSHVETRTLAKLPQSDNGGNNNTDDDGGFFGWIQRAMKGLVDWFKKLLSFFSK